MLLKPDNQEHQWQQHYKIEHISKEKLKYIGQLLDVMEVGVEAQQLFNTSKSTDDEKTEVNTHPSHTKVGGWGLWPMIVP